MPRKPAARCRIGLRCSLYFRTAALLNQFCGRSLRFSRHLRWQTCCALQNRPAMLAVLSYSCASQPVLRPLATVFEAFAVANLLRVAELVCDARCTFVQLRFSTSSAAARYGFRGICGGKPAARCRIGLRCSLYFRTAALLNQFCGRSLRFSRHLRWQTCCALQNQPARFASKAFPARLAPLRPSCCEMKAPASTTWSRSMPVAMPRPFIM
jgi:hypothetical protein